MASSKWPLKCYLCTYMHKYLYRFKALVMWEFLAGIHFLSLFDQFCVILYDNDVFLFSNPWNPFLGFQFNKIDLEPITVLVIP